MFYRKKQYTMTKSEATTTLQNVFEACERPVSNHMDEILAKTFKISGGYKIRILITLIILVITVFLPLFLSPVFSKTHYNANKANVLIKDYEVSGSDLFIDLTGPFLVVSETYAINPSGDIFTPIEIDVWTDQIHFNNYDETEWNIYLNDVEGNTIHLLLIPPQD